MYIWWARATSSSAGKVWYPCFRNKSSTRRIIVPLELSSCPRRKVRDVVRLKCPGYRCFEEGVHPLSSELGCTCDVGCKAREVQPQCTEDPWAWLCMAWCVVEPTSHLCGYSSEVSGSWMPGPKGTVLEDGAAYHGHRAAGRDPRGDWDWRSHCSMLGGFPASAYGRRGWMKVAIHVRDAFHLTLRMNKT